MWVPCRVSIPGLNVTLRSVQPCPSPPSIRPSGPVPGKMATHLAKGQGWLGPDSPRVPTAKRGTAT